MSDEMGPMAFGKKNEEIFLGREIQSHRDYSEETAQKIDHEVVSIIKNAQEVAHKILEDNIDLLHLMAEELLEHETIDARDIKMMMNSKKLSKKNN
jgi:cell division protease FtsH